MRAVAAARVAVLFPVLALVLVTAPWTGCGGGGGPTQAGQALPVTSGLDFVIKPMVSNGTTVDFWWSGATAPGYRIEIGSSPGASDVAAFDTSGPARSFTWSGVPVGNFRARVRSRSDTALGAASNEVLVGSIDARLMIDALIFGRGPLAVRGNAAEPLAEDRMEGWHTGSGFTLIVGQSVPTEVAESAEKTAQQVGPATKGAVHAVVARRPAPLPSPGPGEVTLSVVSPQEVEAQCECDDCVGCAWHWVRGSFIQRGRILVSTDAQLAATAHEIGHAIGLAHVVSAAGVRPPFTMGVTTDGKYSPSGQVTVLEPATVGMLETLYGMGLAAGSSHREFEAAGLVPPWDAGVGASARPGQARRRIVREDGLETIVIEPIFPDCR